MRVHTDAHTRTHMQHETTLPLHRARFEEKEHVVKNWGAGSLALVAHAQPPEFECLSVSQHHHGMVRRHGLVHDHGVPHVDVGGKPKGVKALVDASEDCVSFPLPRGPATLQKTHAPCSIRINVDVQRQRRVRRRCSRQSGTPLAGTRAAVHLADRMHASMVRRSGVLSRLLRCHVRVCFQDVFADELRPRSVDGRVHAASRLVRRSAPSLNPRRCRSTC